MGEKRAELKGSQKIIRELEQEEERREMRMKQMEGRAEVENKERRGREAENMRKGEAKQRRGRVNEKGESG